MLSLSWLSAFVAVAGSFTGEGRPMQMYQQVIIAVVSAAAIGVVGGAVGSYVSLRLLQGEVASIRYSFEEFKSTVRIELQEVVRRTDKYDSRFHDHLTQDHLRTVR